MVNLYLKNEISKYSINNQTDFINATREIIQKLILVGLSKTSFFSYAAFYGGTCLRIFHNLSRYSEDLDFNVIKKDISDFDFSSFIKQSADYVSSFGINCSYNIKNKSEETSVISAFFKFDLNKLKNSFDFPSLVDFTSGQLLTIKAEVETKYIKGATYIQNKLLLPNYSLINCFDIHSLFSGKINALLNRSWGNRIKGRDYFDFYYYVSNNISINLHYLINAHNDIASINDVKTKLIDKFQVTDFDKAKDDVFTFVDYHDELSYLSKDVFIELVELIH